MSETPASASLTVLLDRLKSRPTPPLFAERPWDPDVSEALRSSSPEQRFDGRPIRDPQFAAAAIAGVFLLNDDFEGSHNLCQGLKSDTGSYWHGLCHRREGHIGSGLASNLGNAQYWFRQTGRHAAFPEVYRAAQAEFDASGAGFRWATEASGRLAARGEWDPGAMIDWFAEADRGVLSPSSADLIARIQWREMLTLLEFCLARA